MNAEIKKMRNMIEEPTIDSFLDTAKKGIEGDVPLDTKIDAGIIILKPVGSKNLISIPLSGGLESLRFFLKLPNISKGISEKVFEESREVITERVMESMLKQLSDTDDFDADDSDIN